MGRRDGKKKLPAWGARTAATDEERKALIRRAVAAEFADDNVTEDEVVLKETGEVEIDRRKKKPGSTPMVVGEWD